MSKTRAWWLAVVCGLVTTGCPDFKLGGAGAWGTSPDQHAKGVNVFNCSPYTLGVFWDDGTIPNWDEAEGTTLPVASNCGEGLYIPLNNGVSYTIRYRKDYANCAAGGDSIEFEPDDCSPHGYDRTFTGDSGAADETWEVE